MGAAAVKTKTISLTESVQQTRGKFTVDRASRTIKNAKFIGYESQNKHGHADVDGSEYVREGIREAKPLYEGAQVYLDHPAGRNGRAERSVRDLAGRLANNRDEAEGGFTDIRCNSTAAGNLLLDLAESDPESFGLSHNAEGKSRVDRKRRKVVIESIDKVHSVDVVTRPATTKNVRESQESGTVKTLKQRLESLKLADNAKLVKLLEDEGMAMDAPPAAAAPDAAAGPAGDWRTHLANAITAVITDDSLDEAAVKAKVMAILKLMSDEKKADTDPPADTGEEPTETKESRELKAVRGVLTLCESENYRPTAKEIAILAKLEAAEQKELIGKFKASPETAAPGRRASFGPRSNGIRPLVESAERNEAPKEPKALAAWLKN